MADNKTVGRVITTYAPGTTDRIKKLADGVAAILRKPRGEVTKKELEDELKKVEALRDDDPPLTNVEELNRLSLHSSLETRASSEGLMTSDEIMSRRDTLAFALALPDGGSPGIGKMGRMKSSATGPELPRTSSASGQISRKLPAESGVVVQPPKPSPPRKRFNEKHNKQHIFRKEEGHLEDTPENRKLLEDVSNDQDNYLGPDRNGNDWYAKQNPDGSQTWVQTRGDNIINGGVNATPRPYDPASGLSRPTPPRQ